MFPSLHPSIYSVFLHFGSRVVCSIDASISCSFGALPRRSRSHQFSQSYPGFSWSFLVVGNEHKASLQRYCVYGWKTVKIKSPYIHKTPQLATRDVEEEQTSWVTELLVHLWQWTQNHFKAKVISSATCSICSHDRGALEYLTEWSGLRLISCKTLAEAADAVRSQYRTKSSPNIQSDC